MKQFFFLFSLLIVISSCQKVIDLKMKDTEPKLVIEANYDAVKEKVLVKISYSINVFSADNFPTVVGANVEIIDKNGITSSLIDQGDGSYLLENYLPIYSSEYTMKVAVDGTTYKAKDFLVPIVPLDSLSTTFQEQSFIFDEGYIVSFHFQDPQGPNYYRTMLTVNGEYQKKIGNQLLFDDGLTDNEYHSVPIYWKAFQPKDTVQIQLISYSKQSYNYFQDLFDAVSGSEFSTAPSNPSSTWSPNCLGNFTVYGYGTDSIVVTE